MRIAPKIVLGFTLGMLLVLSVHAILTFRHESEIIEIDRREEGTRLAYVMALAVGLEWDRNGKEAALSLLADVSERDTDMELRWSKPLEPAIGTPTVTSPEGHTKIYSDMLFSSRTIPVGDDPSSNRYGVIQVGQSLSADRVHVRALVFQLGKAVLLVLFINALMVTLLSRRWIERPVAKLLVMASEVGNGNFEARSSLTRRSGIEFSQLSDALNSMAARLAEIERARDRETKIRMDTESQLRHAERLTTMGKLASGVAHEIGTPLNVITGHADMIRRGQVAGDDVQKSAETISAHAGRITKIVKQMLGYVRRKDLQKADTDISSLTAQVLTFLSPFARKHDVELSLASPTNSENQMAVVDPGQIEQVLINIVTNAIQAPPLVEV